MPKKLFDEVKINFDVVVRPSMPGAGLGIIARDFEDDALLGEQLFTQMFGTRSMERPLLHALLWNFVSISDGRNVLLKETVCLSSRTLSLSMMICRLLAPSVIFFS
ncbi:hypothetical protein Salat_0623200 [Sesamum alatum]|uniref:Uncharacterized protein n=1 Tax=Sesamum alatum TaxID=300844 RepID=A0AAE1YQW8_9LAMI|nr:hypothetical protein Salat_0623200 [Sesamum alatum]